MENKDINNISILIDNYDTEEDKIEEDKIEEDKIEEDNIEEDNIEEDKIEHLSDEHFTNKLNATLEPFKKSGILLNEENLIKFNEINNGDLRGSNSPITLSKSGSEYSINTENHSTGGSVENLLPEVNKKITLLKSNNTGCSQIIKNKNKKKRFRKLSFKEVERTIDTFDTDNKISNELDIIIHIFKWSKKSVYTFQKFYKL